MSWLSLLQAMRLVHSRDGSGTIQREPSVRQGFGGLEAFSLWSDVEPQSKRE
jgi:hypothetical protein